MIVHKQLDTGVLLPSSVADVTGAAMKFVNYDSINFHILSTGTVSGTVAIQRSLDGTNWVQVSSSALSAVGITEQLVKGEVALYYRAVVSSYVSGTFEIIFNAA